MLDHLLEHLAVIDSAVLGYAVAIGSPVRVPEVLADVVALLVEETFIHFVIAHEVIIIIAVSCFNPFLSIYAAFLIIQEALFRNHATLIIFICTIRNLRHLFVALLLVEVLITITGIVWKTAEYLQLLPHHIVRHPQTIATSHYLRLL